MRVRGSDRLSTCCRWPGGSLPVGGQGVQGSLSGTGWHGRPSTMQGRGSRTRARVRHCRHGSRIRPTAEPCSTATIALFVVSAAGRRVGSDQDAASTIERSEKLCWEAHDRRPGPRSALLHENRDLLDGFHGEGLTLELLESLVPDAILGDRHRDRLGPGGRRGA